MPEIEPIEGPPVKLDTSVCRARAEHVDVRAERNPNGMPTMTGHFSTFDEWYEIHSWYEGDFIERIAPGAFKKTLKDDAGRKNPGDKIKVLLEHGYDPVVADKPLGVPEALSEDATGPAYEVPLLDTSYCRDLVPALEAGAYGTSFRFQVLRDEWLNKPEASDYNPTAIPERTIKEVRVIEFGPTMFPANPGATVGLRSTTDAYYEKLRSRQPEAFEEAVRSAKSLRSTSVEPAEKPLTDAAPEKETEPTVVTTPDIPAVADVVKPESSPVAPRKHSAEIPKPSIPQRSKAMPEANQLQMTIEERVQRKEDIKLRLNELDTEYNGAQLPDNEQTEWDNISREFDEHTIAIAAASQRADRLRALAGQAAHVENGADPGPMGAPQVMRSRETVWDLAVLRRDARSIEELGRMYRDNALRAVEQSHFPSSPDKAKAQESAERMLRSVDDRDGTLARRFLVTGNERYDRAFGKAALAGGTNMLTNEERAALATGGDATGGFAVPFQLDPTVILTNTQVVNPVRQLARVVQITGKTWQGITSLGISVSRQAEATEATDGAPTFEQPEVTPTRVQGFVPFSFEIDQDWGQLRGELGTMFAEAKDAEESAAFVLGAGTGVNPEGVVTGIASGQLIDTAAATSFTVPDLYALADVLPPRHQANASWLANKATYSKIRQFDSAGGANLWERLGAGMPSQLLGYSAYEASAMATALTAGTKILLLGDFKKLLIVDKIGMNVELIPHLFGTTLNYPTGQRGMYAVWRNSSKVLDSNAFRLLKIKAGS
jgi:HK97 family phage major capsid protein/HK97 family phage prohead protease